jgi:hypothetical protein
MNNVVMFKRFERECSLFDLEIDGVPIWERVRLRVFREIKPQTGSGQAHTSIDKDTTDFLKGLSLWIRNFISRNPYFTSENKYLFIGHPRRQKKPDGFWWDPYCDPIHENCSLDSIHFEMPYLLDHRTPAKTESLRYLEFIHYSGTIQRKLGLHGITLNSDTVARLKEVETEIEQRFNAHVDLTSQVQRLLRNRRCRLWLYERLLDRVNPEVVVVVVSYGKHTLIEACKRKNIPVVELQHGIIYPEHLGYSFAGEKTKTLFPDYLLTWGDFWSVDIEFPITDDRIISVGYPHIEQSKNKYSNTTSRKQILFISQGTIGEQLSKFAMEVAQHPDIDHDIVYKLHPGEYDRWQDEYPWLLNADFEIISNSGPSLYELFTDSSVQVGVYSTAVYEGLAFDLETYVYDCSGSGILNPLIKNGAAELVSSVDELTTSLGTRKNSFESDYYFAPNATESVCEVLKRLADEGTPSL